MQLPAQTDISNTFKLIKDELDQVKKLIYEQFIGVGEPVERLLETFSSGSGKMVRPGLVLLCGSACGKITDKHIRVAAIFEIIHNATLLHDDVIDEGQRRRGLPTVNSLWGNESAVLLGDFLLSKVFEMCADLEPQISKIIAKTTTQICEGELKQIMQRHNWQLSESEYIDIVTQKTAVLFSNCCYLGAFLAGASRAQLRSFGCFGRDVGIAFQITDDLLDIIGDEGKLGKTLGSDIDKNKLTLPVIHLLEAVSEKQKGAAIERLSSEGGNRKALAEMLKSCGSLEYARRRAEEFVTEASNALTDLKKSDAKDALIETAKFVTARVVVS